MFGFGKKKRKKFGVEFYQYKSMSTMRKLNSFYKIYELFCSLIMGY